MNLFYVWTYIIMGILSTYIQYRFTELFLPLPRFSKAKMRVVWIGYFALVSWIYFQFHQPVFIVAANVFLLIAVVWCYDASWPNRLLAGGIVYVLLFLSEMTSVFLVAVVLRVNVFPEKESLMVLQLFLCRTLDFLIFLLAKRWKKAKALAFLDVRQWILILLVPMITIFSVILLVQNMREEDYKRIFLLVTLLLILNLVVFFLYDQLQVDMEKIMEQEYVHLQQKNLRKSLQVMEDTNEQLKELRHDWRKHLLSLQGFLEEKNILEAQKYLKNLQGNWELSAKEIFTGNPGLDALLAFYKQKAKEKKIPLVYHIQMPKDPPFDAFDLCGITGNLLENALEAVEALWAESTDLSHGAERSASPIKLEMVFAQNILYIQTENPCRPLKRRIYDKCLPTTKREPGHGLGLFLVQKAVDKYEGSMDLSQEEKTFYVEVMLFGKKEGKQ